MKKIFLYILMLLIIVPVSVKADSMYNIDMDIYIDEDGNANITEVWDVKADSGSEWYKTMYDLGNSELSNYEVYMDGNKLTYRNNWDIDGSLSSKRGYYGINYASEGMELCFGKGDMRRHKFTLKYTLSNYVFNTSDSQVLYWTLLPKLSVDNFTVDITSYYSFSDTLDVWGYGYKGYAYVKDGKISMSNDGRLNDDYVVLLAKFPLNTFNTLNSVDNYDSFDDVYDRAEEGTFEYDYDEKVSLFFIVVSMIVDFFFTIIPIAIIFFAIKSAVDSGYGYINNKKIDKKELPMFRDIPCNKDIYYANTLIKLNNFGYKESNILGAIILKWVRNNKIGFRNQTTGIFNKETSVIDMTLNPSFDNELEEKLFKMMFEASKDGMLEAKEFEKWCSKNYSEFFSLFKRMENDVINDLKSNNHIYKRVNKQDCKKKNVMDDMIYNDSVELYGLKKYLDEFSMINTKEVMEVKLWDEYLMFAYLFGMADKVAKQLKNMYPEIVEPSTSSSTSGMYFDYEMLRFVDHISVRSVSAASSARSAAESYSSGGGGFSSGGGGGGSFGGGGSIGGR